MPDFIPGLELSRRFFHELIGPALDTDFRGLVYDAALLGAGSEVLGFDTVRSTDHHWGPRLMLFLAESDHAQHAEAIVEALRHRLPHHFLGYSTSFVSAPDEPQTLVFEERTAGPVNHRVEVLTVRQFLHDYLGYDWHPDAVIEPADWLTFGEQKLRSLTHGAVYHAGLGEIPHMRERLAYYPHDVWLYLMAATWTRIAQEEAFVGRCGEAKDDLGSSLVAARLVEMVMRLGFLMEREYAPYAKWFGTAFSQLQCSVILNPIFRRVFSAAHWYDRERHLSAAYTFIAEMHNGLQITRPMPTTVSYFHSRPYLIIQGADFAEAICERIQDDPVRRIASTTLVGGLDVFSDSTDLHKADMRRRLKMLYT